MVFCLILLHWYLVSVTCYLKPATSCKNLIPFAPIVRLALVLVGWGVGVVIIHLFSKSQGCASGCHLTINYKNFSLKK